DLKERQERSGNEARREHDELSGHIRADREQVEALRQALAEGEPQREAVEEWKKQTADTLREAETRLADWQGKWDTHTRDAAEVSRAAEVERTKLDYLDRQAVDNARRREVLESEHQAFDVDALDEAAARLSDDHDQHQQ